MWGLRTWFRPPQTYEEDALKYLKAAENGAPQPAPKRKQSPKTLARNAMAALVASQAAYSSAWGTEAASKILATARQKRRQTRRHRRRPKRKHKRRQNRSQPRRKQTKRKNNTNMKGVVAYRPANNLAISFFSSDY